MKPTVPVSDPGDDDMVAINGRGLHRAPLIRVPHAA